MEEHYRGAAMEALAASLEREDDAYWSRGYEEERLEALECAEDARWEQQQQKERKKKNGRKN